jgi:U3 small nucleolar RNA-associated protein 10
VYPPLVLLSRTVRLADEPFLAILEGLITTDTGANPAQRILTLLVLLNDRPGWTAGLGEDDAEKLSSIPRLGDLLVAGLEKYGMGEAIGVIVASIAER